jgi:hypothetical protein
MSSKVGHYRVRAEECCLNAVKVEDNSRRIHWLEATPAPLRLPEHIGLPPRLDRLQRASAISAAQPLRQLSKRKARRDSRKPLQRSYSYPPAARAMALDVGVALTGKLLDGGVKRVHLACPIRAFANRPSSGVLQEP